MRWILRTTGGMGSLANLMPLIGFHYKRCLLIEEITGASALPLTDMNGVASI
jgi:hypothetical protein